ncbi:MAG: anaerobic sulfatase maturase [Candidatus Heimdallarchaeota archaeon]|nr:MAG: anaerobic sulfatase maturase [Candidatus Heimdallarchaeota archaeon]
MIPNFTSFHIMVKPYSSICNLECQYCYYLSTKNLYPNSNCKMNDETLEKFTQQYIAAQEVPEVTFSWQGGEPTLMDVKFFEKAIQYQKIFNKHGIKVQNTLQTNGTLLTKDWARFFKKHNFLIGISIDGPSDLHDEYRVDNKGNPTFDQVISGLDNLKKYKVDFNILTCVHTSNVDYPLDVYRSLRDELGGEFIQFIPIVETNGSGSISDFSVTGRQYGSFLQIVFKEWVKHDVGRVYVQIFEVSLAAWLNLPLNLCILAPTCGNALALEHNGDIYACDHFVTPQYFRGNLFSQSLRNIVNSQEQKEFGLNKSKLPLECQQCEVRYVCNGGCPKNRLIKTDEEGVGMNYLCEGYKMFFSFIDPYMKYMGDQIRRNKPAANIMDHLRHNPF